ncbi:hypothetical protein [Halobacterium yunchengense]|uniref:hypothetical protein n=1 Tax=Halobacterium yunchengense TaxID=3108497 RepID=UPI00300B3C95
MSEPGPRDLAPLWVWLTTAASTLLTVVAVVATDAGVAVVGPLAAVAVAGVTALLYRWGQLRDRDPGSDADGRDRREREVEANNDGWS